MISLVKITISLKKFPAQKRTLDGTAVGRSCLRIRFPVLLTCVLCSLSVVVGVELIGGDIIREVSSTNILGSTKPKSKLSSQGVPQKYINVGSQVFYGEDDTHGEQLEDNLAPDNMDADQFVLEESQNIEAVHHNLRRWTGPKANDGVDGLNDEQSGSRATSSVNGRNRGLPSGREYTGIITTDSYTIDDIFKRLKKFKRDGLQGQNDPAEVITEVRKAVKAHLDHMISIQAYLHDGNANGAGLALKSMIRGSNTLVDMKKKLTNNNGLNFPSSYDTDSFSLDSAPDDQVAQFIPAEAFDEIVEHAQEVHELLDRIDLSIFSTPHRHEPLKNEQIELEESANIDNSFEFAGGQPRFFPDVPSGNWHPSSNIFKNTASMKHFWRHNQLSSGLMPKLSKYTKFHHNDIVMAKHQLRIEALGDTCGRGCDLNNSTCLCGRLFDCISDMTEYDLAVLVAGGFIDTNPSSNTFGNFSVTANQLNLYNADEGVAVKLSGLKSRASENSINTDNCKAVLGELFSACDPDESTCTNPNVQSFSVEIEQVCDTVNSHKKLLFEVIGEEFDGFVDKFTEAPCEPLSYDVCAEFLVQFDILYQGRDTVEYPLANPMLKIPTNTVFNEAGNNKEVFDRVQFPIRYNFQRDQTTGVVTREFPNPNVATREFSKDVHTPNNEHQYYEFVNGLADNAGSLTFDVEASNDAHIALGASSVAYESGANIPDHYFIFIGGRKNTLSMMRFSRYGDEIESRSYGTFLDGAAFRKFRISWTSSNLRVEYYADGSGWTDMMAMTRNYETATIENGVYQETIHRHFIDHVMVSTGYGSTGFWRLISSTRSFPFLLTNPTSGKVLGLSGGSCADFTPIEVQDRAYSGNIYSQQFILTGDGRLASEACSNKVLSNKWNVGGIRSCRNGNELTLRPSRNTDLQRWTFVRDGSGIVNSRCGKWNGNLAISAIEDDSITKVDYTDTIPVQFINPESNLAIGLESGSCVNRRKVDLQTVNNGSDDQTFYLKRVADGSGTWKIHSKVCPEMVLEGQVGSNHWQRKVLCDTESAISLYNVSFYREPIMGKCQNSLNERYQGVQANPSLHGWTQDGCATFCKGQPGFIHQVGFWFSTDDCFCSYECEKLPSQDDLSNNDQLFPNATGCGPIAARNTLTGSDLPYSCVAYNNDKRNQWKIKDGKLESALCEGMVMTIGSTSIPQGSNIVLAPNNARGWNQAWSTKSNAARLLTENGHPSQAWKAVSAQPAYDYGLLPGFPGTEEQEHWYHQIVGDGWCQDANGREGTARYFFSGDQATVRAACNQDNSCVAFAYNDGGSSPVYSSSNGLCTTNCDRTAWINDRSLITRTSGHSGYSCFVKESCMRLSSTTNKDIAKSAMHSCDASMSLLLGSITSVGTLRTVASLISEEGTEHMPGTCCLDVATNSDFFGYRYDPKLEDSEGSKMTCKHRGPWHLGISEEACENAGGKWYRTPCITLQICIDKRPPRFDLEAPSPVSCQTTLRRMNTASVFSSTSPFNTTETGCFKFCQSLPDYPLQIGMEIEGTDITKCVCLYNNDKVPSKALLPDYAIRSPPKFSLTDATGKLALGLSQKMICTSDEISVEFQKHDGSPRQEFQLAYDGRIVSVACPGKVITAAGTESGSRLVAKSLFPTSGHSTQAGTTTQSCPIFGDFCNQNAPDFHPNGVVCANDGQPDEAYCNYDIGPKACVIGCKPPDFWSFNDDGTVTNAANSLGISANTGNLDTLTSFYFTLENPKSHLTIGFVGTSCQNGTRIVQQKLVYGSPNQQFTIEGDKIVSVKCPHLAIHIASTTCEPGSELALSGKDEASAWQFSDDDGIQIIESENCQGSFIALGHGPSGSFAAVRYIQFDNNTVYDQVSNSQSPLPQAGEGIVLSSNSTAEHYLKWTLKHNRFQPMSGPFSFVNPTSGSAIGVKHGICADGMMLEAQSDDYDDIHQQFLLGRHGLILSAKCPGLVLSTEGECEALSETLVLRTYMLNEQRMKWKLHGDGKIESMQCPGAAIIAVPELILAIPTQSDGSSLIWRLENVRLLDAGGTSLPSWIRGWSLNFADEGYSRSELQEYGIEEISLVKHIHVSRPSTETSSEGVLALGEVTAIDSTGGNAVLTSRGATVTCSSQYNANAPQNVINGVIDLRVFVSQRELGPCWEVTLDIPHVIRKVRFAPSDRVDDYSGVKISLLSEDRTVIAEQTIENHLNQVALDFTQAFRSDPYPSRCYKPNLAFNRGFEDFVAINNIIITDPADEDQCERAREELGFDPDHPFDTEVCKKFNEFMCDPFFTGLDDVIESLAGPPQFEQVKYEDVEYEEVKYEAPDYAEDDKLPFETIDSKNHPTIEQMPLSNQESLVGLQKNWLDLQNSRMVFQHTFDSLSFHYENCDTMPDSICIPVIMGQGGCVTNPAIYICKGVAFTLRFYSYVVLLGLDIAYEAVDRNYEISTLGPNQAIYGYEYSAATYTDLLSHIDWSETSLKKINQNMHDQHQSMRQHLQDRHFAMEANIGQDIFDAQNALGQAVVDARNANGLAIIDAQNAISGQHTQMFKWLSTNLCAIYESSAIGGACATFIGPLEEGQMHIPLELYWPEGQLTLVERLQQMEEIKSKDEGGMNDDRNKGVKDSVESKIGATMDVVDSKMNAVEGKIDAKMSVVEGKMNAIEGKVDTIDGKVDAIESNVKAAVEGKINSVEGKINAQMNAVEGKIDAVEGKIAAVEAMTMHLVEQNTKLMQLMEHKAMGKGVSIEDAV